MTGPRPGWVQRQVDLARPAPAVPAPDGLPYSLDTPLGRAVAALALGAAYDRRILLPAEDCAALFAELDRLRQAEHAPWLLDMVREVGLAAEEIACNGDHEAHEGCDGCAWEALHEAVPVRIRNAADEAAAR